ncbi:MAG: ADOP family duplicated permease [Gemmatimonadota bacterium]|nr:ADOP family duplicated permease [Gemmatimonadota bacterium]
MTHRTDRGGRLRDLLARANPGPAIDQELAAHVEMRARQLMAEGMTEDDAWTEARRRFGDPGDVRVECEQSDRRWRRRLGRRELFRSVATDARLAVRAARHAPGPTVLAVVALALGTGVGAAILAVASGVLLRDLPYPDPAMLAGVHAADARDRSRPGLFSFREVEVLAGARTADVAGYSVVRPPLTGDGLEPSEITLARITDGFFRVLAAPPLIGRTPTTDETRAGLPVAVLSHALWTARFGADPAVPGRTVDVEGLEHTIIGVMPPRFAMPEVASMWRPLSPAEAQDDDRELHVVARIADGASFEAASAELDAAFAAFQSETAVPDDELRSVMVESARDALVRPVRGPLWLLVGAAALVLLVACVNVSNLLLARAEMRHDQVVLRRALGADGFRIVRAHLTESLLFALAGGALGLLLGRVTLPLLLRIVPEGTPRLAEVSFDARVGVAMTGVVLGTAILTGLVPAWRATRATTVTRSVVGRLSTSGSTRILHGFVTAQIAISTALAVGALLLGVTFTRLMTVDRGFRPTNTIVVPLALSEEGEELGVSAAYARILEEARALPGVDAAHLVYHAPDEGGGFRLRLLRPEGFVEDAVAEGSVVPVTPGYFDALGIGVVDGRGFLASDDPGPPVAVVSRSFARRLLPEPARAVGSRFVHHASLDGGAVEVAIVGVVDDIIPEPSEPPPPILYVPFGHMPFGYAELVVTTTAATASVLPALRARIWTVDPNVPLDAARTLEEAVARSVASPRFYMVMVVGFASLAVLLAAIGTYGVTAFVVAQRTHEAGIRAALGADSRRILTRFLGQGLRPALLGIAAGLGAAAALSRFLAGLLFDVAPLEPWVYAAVAGVLGLIALGAVAVPARRAAGRDPLTALRHE